MGEMLDQAMDVGFGDPHLTRRMSEIRRGYESRGKVPCKFTTLVGTGLRLVNVNSNKSPVLLWIRRYLNVVQYSTQYDTVPFSPLNH